MSICGLLLRNKISRSDGALVQHIRTFLQYKEQSIFRKGLREFFLSRYIVCVMDHLRFTSLLFGLVLVIGCQKNDKSPVASTEQGGRSVLLDYGKNESEACDPQAEPEIQAVFAGNGTLVWEDSQGFPARGDIFESVELRGRNLCNATFMLGDGVTPPRTIQPKQLSGTSVEFEMPWDFHRVDLALVVKKPGIQLRLDLSILPVDQVRRQLYVNKYRVQRF